MEIETKSSTDILQVKKADLPELAKTKDLHTVVRVEDDNYVYEILLDDMDGQKFWHKFDGVHTEETIRMNEMFKRGQKIFREKAYSQADVEYLRDLLISIMNLSKFYGWSEEETTSFVDSLIVKFSFNVYKKEMSYDGEMESLKDNPDFIGYLNATAIYVKTYVGLLQEVSDSVKQAGVEEAKVPDDATGVVG